MGYMKEERILDFVRDLYIFPTILIHNGDGIYHTVEIAWLKWYIGIGL